MFFRFQMRLKERLRLNQLKLNISNIIGAIDELRLLRYERNISMSKKMMIALAFVFLVSSVTVGVVATTMMINNDRQNYQSEKKVKEKKEKRPDEDKIQKGIKSKVSAEELKQIKVYCDVNDGVKKDGKQSYSIVIVNESDKVFNGTVHISTEDANPVDWPEFKGTLQPGESISGAGFGKRINFNTEFKYEVNGSLTSVEKKALANTPTYKIIDKKVGEGYCTFWVSMDSLDDSSLIAVAKEFKANYADAFKKGFQIRFIQTGHQIVNNTAEATYAYTPHLKLSKVISFVDDSGGRDVADGI